MQTAVGVVANLFVFTTDETSRLEPVLRASPAWELVYADLDGTIWRRDIGNLGGLPPEIGGPSCRAAP